jgi:predicted phosphohydrolase
VYGHLHGVHPTRALSNWQGIKLHFVACDAVEFRPQMLFEIEPSSLVTQTQAMR